MFNGNFVTFLRAVLRTPKCNYKLFLTNYNTLSSETLIVAS
jgi:hypothetical protein